MTAENNTPDPGAPDTIVLIHGLWVTPRSWEHWIERYEGRGYRVLAPAYPGLAYFNEVGKGGHFAAWEEPQLFSEEVRAAFRSLR